MARTRKGKPPAPVPAVTSRLKADSGALLVTSTGQRLIYANRG